MEPTWDSGESTARRQIDAFLGGEAEAVDEVRRWVRGASTPYRRKLAHELEDLEQEVIVELTEALREGRFRGESLLATYVRRMVHYKCLNRLRRSQGRQWVDIEEIELPTPGPTPFDRSAERQSIEVALKVVALMSENCRELWRMIHAGMSYRQMSEKIEVAPGTLRVRVLRCRQKALEERDRLVAGGVTKAGLR